MAVTRGIVYIKDSEGTLLTDKTLILESDVSLGISNEYAPLVSGGGSAVLSAVVSSLNVGISAGFAQQGFQVWKSTNPIELKLSVSLRMRTSGKLDVVDPAKALIRYAVPSLAGNGWGLIPPGPNILTILGDEKGKALGDTFSFLKGSGGYVSVSIGSYLNLSKCIMKNVIPTYSLQEDSDGYPISCKLDIDLSTVEIATSTMIDGLSS